jgi:glycosyltransferase involved in cell wall biosynthesis
VIRQFDVVCCALDPNDIFNKSKSAIKALEAMAAKRRLPCGKFGGAVPVCTDMSVYRRAVNHGHNGLLVDNDQWYAALKKLVTDRSYTTRLSVQGHNWVRRNRDIAQGWKLWESTYRRMCRESGLY